MDDFILAHSSVNYTLNRKSRKMRLKFIAQKAIIFFIFHKKYVASKTITPLTFKGMNDPCDNQN